MYNTDKHDYIRSSFSDNFDPKEDAAELAAGAPYPNVYEHWRRWGLPPGVGASLGNEENGTTPRRSGDKAGSEAEKVGQHAPDQEGDDDAGGYALRDFRPLVRRAGADEVGRGAEKSEGKTGSSLIGRALKRRQHAFEKYLNNLRVHVPGRPVPLGQFSV